MNEAIVCYGLCGRTTNAAQMSKDCAEKAEEEYDYTFALKMFDQAVNYYDMDNQTNMANTMRIKWVDLHILDSSD